MITVTRNSKQGRIIVEFNVGDEDVLIVCSMALADAWDSIKNLMRETILLEEEMKAKTNPVEKELAIASVTIPKEIIESVEENNGKDEADASDNPFDGEGEENEEDEVEGENEEGEEGEEEDEEPVPAPVVRKQQVNRPPQKVNRPERREPAKKEEVNVRQKPRRR